MALKLCNGLNWEQMLICNAKLHENGIIYTDPVPQS